MARNQIVIASADYTQTEAATLPEAAGLPYLGVWFAPTETPMAVHVFAAYTEQQLAAAGWTRAEQTEESA